MSSTREKTTFRRGRANRGPKRLHHSRRGRHPHRGRRNQQRNIPYRKRPKETTILLTKQDFFNVGLLVLERGFEHNGLEDLVRANPDVLVEQKRGVIVDTRKEFRLRVQRGGAQASSVNSRNKVIGSMLEGLRHGEALPQWYQEDDGEEFGEELLTGGFDKKGGKGVEEGDVEDLFRQWKAEEREDEERTTAVMESLLHVSSDEEDEEWGQGRGKLEQSALNLTLDKGFTLATLAGQTEVLDQAIGRPKAESEEASGGKEEEGDEEEDDDADVFRSLNVLGRLKGNEETFFEDLDKQIEESFMVAKKEEGAGEKEEAGSVGQVLDAAWKPGFQNDFEEVLSQELLEGLRDDASVNMEDMLQQVDNEYEGVFAGFESNMNKILYGSSFMDDSLMSVQPGAGLESAPDFEAGGGHEGSPDVLGELDLEAAGPGGAEQESGAPEGEDSGGTAGARKAEKEPELTAEEKEKRKQMFLQKYQMMIMMLDEMARDAMAWHRRNKKKSGRESLPENGLTRDSVDKYTSTQYKIFSMLCRGCLFFKSWYYKDSEGEKHGPYMAFDMDVWNIEGKLGADFLISPDDKTYMAYEKFNERDKSIFDLMDDVMKEHERVFKMNALKMEEERIKRQEQKRALPRGRQRERHYRRRGRGDERGRQRGRPYKKDYGEFYFKRKNARGKGKRSAGQRFDPQSADVFKKKERAQRVDEEEFPTLGAEAEGGGPQGTAEPGEQRGGQGDFKRKAEKPEQKFEAVGFDHPDEIPGISKAREPPQAPKSPAKAPKKKEQPSMISRWDEEELGKRRTGKKRRRRRKHAKRPPEEEEKNEELTDNIKKMLDI